MKQDLSEPSLEQHLKLLRFTDPQITCRTNRNINFNLQTTDYLFENAETRDEGKREREREKKSLFIFINRIQSVLVFIIQHF